MLDLREKLENHFEIWFVADLHRSQSFPPFLSASITFIVCVCNFCFDSMKLNAFLSLGNSQNECQIELFYRANRNFFVFLFVFGWHNKNKNLLLATAHRKLWSYFSNYHNPKRKKKNPREREKYAHRLEIIFQGQHR